jgi:hypothetical protein
MKPTMATEKTAAVTLINRSHVDAAFVEGPQSQWVPTC